MRYALAGLLLLGTAQAQNLEKDPLPRATHFALEIKMGAYSPDIDSSPGLGGKKPFSDLFGAGGERPGGALISSLEFDWQLLHGAFGSLGIGGGVGFSRRSAQAFEYDRSTGQYVSCQLSSCTRSGDTTALSVMPITLELVYRFDLIALRTYVPIVPYLKGGVGYYLWWIENGSGSIATYNSNGMSDRGIGGTFGLVAHPGVALLLDRFDEATARTVRSEIGIQHTYAFGELHYAWVNGFNSSTKMVLSDLTWNAGLAFEF